MKTLSFQEKITELIQSGEARDYHHACSILGKRSGIARRARSKKINKKFYVPVRYWWQD